jgi:hypothetical protein
MADNYAINRAMQDLGGLWAAEHAEGDDDGVTQVEALVKGLRKFKQHEDAEHQRLAKSPVLREAAYQLADGRSVYYDDGRESLRDAADTYAVLPEETPGGSPNLENLKARHILDRLQTGMGLGETHIGELRGLMTKHRDKIAALRADPDRNGQDPLAIASAGSDSRIIN